MVHTLHWAKVRLLVNRNKLNPLDCLSSFRSFKLQLVLMLFWKRKTEHELLSYQLICLINIKHSDDHLLFSISIPFFIDLGKLGTGWFFAANWAHSDWATQKVRGSLSQGPICLEQWKLFWKVSLPENVSDTIWNPSPIFLDPSNTGSNARDPDKSPLRLFLELFCINHRYKDERTTKLLVNSGICADLCWIKWPIF